MGMHGCAYETQLNNTEFELTTTVKFLSEMSFKRKVCSRKASLLGTERPFMSNSPLHRNFITSPMCSFSEEARSTKAKL